jgi:hypothetical protein
MLPKLLRTAAPDRLRDDARLRAVAISAGLIPPRTLHSVAEAALLGELARGASRVVELGVYEAASAQIFISVLGPGTELHLIDPFIDASGWALPAGWAATPQAARAVVRRALGTRAGGGPTVSWHVAPSQCVGASWTGGPVDLVFIDGDHSPEGCRQDWDLWAPHVRPGGHVAFHDARGDAGDGGGSPGPTGVVDALFHRGETPAGWQLSAEVDTLVVVERVT